MIAGAKADDKCAGPPGEAEHSGPHPRAQQALLQHCHQLQEGQCLSSPPPSQQALALAQVSVSALVGFVCVILQNLNNFSPPDPNVIFQGSSGVKLVMPNVIIETVRK